MVNSMATAVVLLGIGLLLIIGAILVGGARERGPTRRCPRAGCRAVNRADARFCSTCGGSFGDQPDKSSGHGG